MTFSRWSSSQVNGRHAQRDQGAKLISRILRKMPLVATPRHALK